MNNRLKGQMAVSGLNETSGPCDARRLNRKDPDEAQQRALVVEAAKLGFSMLASCAELIEKDLDYAYILFTLILRTHLEANSLSRSDRATPSQMNVASNIGITANVYEIAKYTGMNRATVRRKMLKLEELGLVSRFDDERWILGRDGEGPPEAVFLLAAQIKRQTDEFARAVSETCLDTETVPAIAEELLERTTVSQREARKKISKGAFYFFKHPDF